ncbi:MAG: hypothetical protein KMY53_10730 [Desulfarculus sp.]|nr:hypothetical protein [Pseudomonadota bacterium]MBV1715903.1 hypothetical protein [Desulfarculus sp.]MBU4576969.1 hypothetical protein [Pseudomonadota bacterium]MBU4600255.1 hypothetical protein [Pseudomonadota bacterium]MBV1738629.1 hypothetical protein [Desulfarculus sp.]
MQPALLPLCLALLLFCALPAPAAAPVEAQVPVREIVDRAVEAYVQRTGNQVVGMGSWIKGTTYRNPLTSPDPSDHDMTPLFKSKDPLVLEQQWKSMQSELRESIEKGLRQAKPGITRQEVDKVMRSVNVYPPESLVADVVDEKEAMERFSRMKAKPNLGGAPVEGVWGKAKKPFTQAYSQSAGRTYFRDPKGIVRKGFTDLDNLAAGYGRFSLEATSDLAEQFAKKARLAMAEGRGADALKNLNRLNQYLRKGKNAAGISGAGNLNPELLEAMADAQGLDLQDADTMRNWLERNQRILGKGLGHADDELALLKRIAVSTDGDELKYLKSLQGNKLRRFMSWARGMQGKMGQALNSGKAVAAQVPWDKAFKAAVALGVAIELYNAASLYQTDGWDAANQSLSLAGINLIPSNILGQLMLDYGTEVGYDLVAAPQGCENLLAGIYEVKGRQRLGQGEQIEDLARRCLDEQCVSEAVERQAEAASHKDLEKESYAGVKGSRAIKARLMGQCLPVILQAWKRERYRLLGLALLDKRDLDKMLSGSLLVLEAPGSGGGQTREYLLRPQFTLEREPLRKLLVKFEDDLKLLGGPGKMGRLSVGERFHWRVEVFDFRQGKWLPFKQPPDLSRHLDPRNRHTAMLGQKAELKLALPAGPNYRVGLEYSLVAMPAVPPLGYRAPEVEEFSRELRATYGLKALLPLETGNWRLKVSGPKSLAAGAPGKLSARVEGDPPWGKGFTTQVIWEQAPGSARLGQGPELAITGPAQGNAQYRAVLVGQVAGREERLAEEMFTLAAQGFAWLRMSAVDKLSRQPLAGASWRISGPDGFSARRQGASFTIEQAPAGSYRVEVSAPEHQNLQGPLTLEAGKRYDKVAPLVALPQPKPEAKAKSEDRPVVTTGPKNLRGAPAAADPLEGMTPDQICSCYEQWFLKVKKKPKKPGKERTEAKQAMRYQADKKRCWGEYTYHFYYEQKKRWEYNGVVWTHFPSLRKASGICKSYLRSQGTAK